MPNNNLEFTSDLDSLSERIETHRAACTEFFHSRRKRLKAIEHGLFENLNKITQQHDQWSEFRTKTEEQQNGLNQERQQLDVERADVEARMLEVEEKSLEVEEQLNSREEKSNALREQVAALRQQLESSEKKEQEFSAQASDSLRLATERSNQIKTLQEQLKESAAEAASQEDLTKLKAERDKLATTIRRLKKTAQQESVTSSQELESLKSELEQLKSSNDSLQLQLQVKGSQGVPANVDAELDDDFSDWERRKQDLLRHLSETKANLMTTNALESITRFS